MVKFKHKVKMLLNQFQMLIEYYHDYRDYKRWNYNNPKVKSQSALEAKILRQTHILEKGMSLPNPRIGFGQEKIKELFKMMEEYLKYGFSADSIAFQNAICVSKQYVLFQERLGYKNIQIIDEIRNYEKYIIDGIAGGIGYDTLDSMLQNINGKFPEFFKSRHSMRQFSDEKIDFNDVSKAVELAMKAPTACNRQACKVYYYEDAEMNRKLGELIAGNTGFENEVQKYLVITSDLSSFYDSFERNQIYVEAGIFSMALVQALHYYKIGSCILQNGEFHTKNQKFKNICGNISQNEKIVLFVAIGYYKNEFTYAISNRKRVKDILIR